MWPAISHLFRWLRLRLRLTSLLSIGCVVCFPIATCPTKPGSVGVRICHHHRIQPRPQVKVIFRYLRPDAPVSTTTDTQHLWAWWHFGNYLVDIILGRIQLSQQPLIHSTSGHYDIPVIEPFLSIYLSTTSAVFTPAGHVNILQLYYNCNIWCNGYPRRKWTRRLEFKSWTRMIAFHIVVIPLGKVWFQLFCLQLWVNSRTDWFFSLDEATSLGKGKLWIQTC